MKGMYTLLPKNWYSNICSSTSLSECAFAAFNVLKVATGVLLLGKQTMNLYLYLICLPPTIVEHCLAIRDGLSRKLNKISYAFEVFGVYLLSTEEEPIDRH